MSDELHGKLLPFVFLQMNRIEPNEWVELNKINYRFLGPKYLAINLPLFIPCKTKTEIIHEDILEFISSTENAPTAYCISFHRTEFKNYLCFRCYFVQFFWYCKQDLEHLNGIKWFVPLNQVNPDVKLNTLQLYLSSLNSRQYNKIKYENEININIVTKEPKFCNSIDCLVLRTRFKAKSESLSQDSNDAIVMSFLFPTIWKERKIHD